MLVGQVLLVSELLARCACRSCVRNSTCALCCCSRLEVRLYWAIAWSRTALQDRCCTSQESAGGQDGVKRLPHRARTRSVCRLAPESIRVRRCTWKAASRGRSRTTTGEAAPGIPDCETPEICFRHDSASVESSQKFRVASAEAEEEDSRSASQEDLAAVEALEGGAAPLIGLVSRGKRPFWYRWRRGRNRWRRKAPDG